MSSAPTSYLAFLVTAIGNTVIIAIGAIVSLAAPALLLFGLCELSAPFSVTPQLSGEEVKKAKSSHEQPWNAVVCFTVPCALLGYIAGGYSYYLAIGSVFEGVMKGTILVVGVSVGVAACLAVMIGLGRWLSQPSNAADGKGAKDVKD